MTNRQLDEEMAEEMRTDTLAEILKAIWVLDMQLERLREQQRRIDREVCELESMYDHNTH